jgi:hypothetical protein
VRPVLLGLGALIALAGIAPYVLDVIHSRTRPRIVSWFNWSLLTAIATAAALSAKQYPSAVITGVATVSTMAVVIAALNKGNRQFEKLDIICQVGAIFGLILWIIFDNPLVAIIATVIIDLIAAIPTWKHAWRKPHEETSISYFTASLGGILTIAAIHNPRPLGLIYPIYLTLADGLLFSIIKIGSYRYSY